MQKINFQDLPSTTTPISATNLNAMQTNVETAIDGHLVNVSSTNDSNYKVNFIKSKNLYNINDDYEGYVYSSTGELTANSSWNASPLIEVSGKITFSCDTSNTREYNITQFDSSKGFISRSSKYTDSTKTITLNSSTKYIALSYVNSDGMYNIQIELGQTATTYENFKQNVINVNDTKYTDTINVDTSVDNAKKINVLHSRNLFNKDGDTILLNTYILDSTQVIKSNNSTNSIYIPITGGKTYTISKKLSARFSVGTTKVLPTINVQTYDYIINNTATSITINTASDSKYLIVYLYNSGSDTLTFQQIIDSVMINEGSTTLPYEPYITSSINVDGEEIYNANIMNYSTEEQVIGKWIDGKPLYRKVVDLGNLPNNTIKNVAHGLTISNVRIRNFYGIASYSTYYLHLPNITSDNTNDVLYINTDNIVIKTNTNRSSYTGYCILEYTKTTD